MVTTIGEDFDLYVGVDWSGAEPGPTEAIKVAVCEPGSSAPSLQTPDDAFTWSRSTFADWLERISADQRILAGLDFSFSFPFIDLGAYFPDLAAAPKRARDLWTLINEVCDGNGDYYGRPFVRHPDFQRYFHSSVGKGTAFQRRFRLCEHICRESNLGAAQSVFHLIGPNQVGFGSLAGMRFLRSKGRFAVWPFDKVLGSRSVLVEVYCAAFLRMSKAGPVKIRANEQLNIALEYFASEPIRADSVLDDHAADAILTSAALRNLASVGQYWSPRLLSDKVRRTEGWIFGIQ